MAVQTTGHASLLLLLLLNTHMCCSILWSGGPLITSFLLLSIYLLWRRLEILHRSSASFIELDYDYLKDVSTSLIWAKVVCLFVCLFSFDDDDDDDDVVVCGRSWMIDWLVVNGLACMCVYKFIWACGEVCVDPSRLISARLQECYLNWTYQFK